MPQREAYTLDIPMVPDEELADLIETTIESTMRQSERSQWSSSHRLGVSDIGHCREYVRRMLAQEPFSDEESDSMAAFVGTAVGSLLEANMPGEWTTQDSVTVALDVDTSYGPIRLNLPGHPDAYNRSRVLDFKTTHAPAVKARYGPSLQQKFQPTLYAKALIADGKVDPDPLISIVFLDRTSRTGSRPTVFSWRYDEEIVEMACMWLSDVFDAAASGTEAPRDKERHWCMDWCPFATACRGGDTDVEGLILNREVEAAAEVYLDAQRRRREAEIDLEGAKAMLKGVAGVTRTGINVRTVSVGPQFVPEGWRNGYDRVYVSAGSTGKRSRT